MNTALHRADFAGNRCEVFLVFDFDDLDRGQSIGGMTLRLLFGSVKRVLVGWLEFW